MISSLKYLSDPFIITCQCSNTGTSYINAQIGNANIAIPTSSPNYQNPQQGSPPIVTNLNIASGVPGVSYYSWLSQTANKPFKVGRTMVIYTTPFDPSRPQHSAAVIAQQIKIPVSITHLDASGRYAVLNYVPTLQPQNVRVDTIMLESEYLFDGYSYLTISELLPNVTAQIWIFQLLKDSNKFRKKPLNNYINKLNIRNQY